MNSRTLCLDETLRDKVIGMSGLYTVLGGLLPLVHFLLSGEENLFSVCSAPVLPQWHRKTLVILPKVQVAGYT